MENRTINMEKGGTYNEGISTAEQSILTIPINKEILEKSYLKFLESTIAPALEPYGDILIQQCKEAIEKIVTQDIIERVKAEVHIENREYHFERIQQRLNEEIDDSLMNPLNEDVPKSEAVERAELIKEWITEIGDIKKEDEELSAIWEGWFIEINRDEKVADQKRALEIMKTLSAEEARLMLDIKERGKIKIIPQSDLPVKEKALQREKVQYLVNQLIKRELITKVNMFSIRTVIPLIALFSCAIVAFIFFRFDIKDVFIHSETLPIAIIMALTILIGLSAMLLQKKYRLTWVGEKIVSYANKNLDMKKRNIKTLEKKANG